MLGFRFFSSHLTRTQRRVYGGVFVFYLFAFFAMVPPILDLFNEPRPLVLGIPLALFYIAGVVTLSFLVLLCVYVWEGRRSDGNDDTSGEDTA